MPAVLGNGRLGRLYHVFQDALLGQGVDELQSRYLMLGLHQAPASAIVTSCLRGERVGRPGRR